jgi:large subunit ribosomal protein L19
LIPSFFLGQRWPNPAIFSRDRPFLQASSHGLSRIKDGIYRENQHLAFAKPGSSVSIGAPGIALERDPSAVTPCCRSIMSQQILQAVESAYLKPNVDEFGIGDTVDVHTKIQEGNKERIQIFSGTVIARSGSGSREMFVVRRIVAGEGVERKFPVHSPKIEKIEVKRRSVVRRAKLYFLRERTGKGVRLRERRD